MKTFSLFKPAQTASTTIIISKGFQKLRAQVNDEVLRDFMDTIVLADSHRRKISSLFSPTISSRA